MSTNSNYTLENGSRVAVIGGGPAGCFFSIFFIRLAQLLDLDIHVDIFEYRNFKADGPAGCNMCAGVISEGLVQLLSIEGIIIPDNLIEIYGESRAQSLYRWGPPSRRVAFRFVAKGEGFLPSALASMVAKYLRELAMKAFNAFWQQRVPGVKPTAGYPVDARRFLTDIDGACRDLKIATGQIWRKC